jgi:hypothetical protein
MGSGINPYAPPRDLESGNIEFSGGGFEFECAEGGKEIAAKQAKLGVNLNDSEYRRYEFDGQKYACEPGVGKVIDETEGDEAVSPYGMPVSKKGWCSLSPKAPPEAFALLLILPALATLVLRFRRP